MPTKTTSGKRKIFAHIIKCSKQYFFYFARLYGNVKVRPLIVFYEPFKYNANPLSLGRSRLFVTLKGTTQCKRRHRSFSMR